MREERTNEVPDIFYSAPRTTGTSDLSAGLSTLLRSVQLTGM